MCSTPVLSTDEDIEIRERPFLQIVCKIQAIAYGICMEERGIQYIKVRRSKTLKGIVQAIAELVTLAEENYFDIKKVLIKPRKDEYSSAKEKDLQSIPDLISGSMKRMFLEHLRELGGT